MTLAELLSERDMMEFYEARLFPHHLPEITRHDALDYEIEQELRR